MTIRGRLEKLEGAHKDGPCIVIWQHHEESTESAMTRWATVNCDSSKPDKAGARIYFVRWAAPSPQRVPA